MAGVAFWWSLAIPVDGYSQLSLGVTEGGGFGVASWFGDAWHTVPNPTGGHLFTTADAAIAAGVAWTCTMTSTQAPPPAVVLSAINAAHQHATAFFHWQHWQRWHALQRQWLQLDTSLRQQHQQPPGDMPLPAVPTAVGTAAGAPTQHARGQLDLHVHPRSSMAATGASAGRGKMSEPAAATATMAVTSPGDDARDASCSSSPAQLQRPAPAAAADAKEKQETMDNQTSAVAAGVVLGSGGADVPVPEAAEGGRRFAARQAARLTAAAAAAQAAAVALDEVAAAVRLYLATATA